MTNNRHALQVPIIVIIISSSSNSSSSSSGTTTTTTRQPQSVSQSDRLPVPSPHHHPTTTQNMEKKRKKKRRGGGDVYSSISSQILLDVIITARRRKRGVGGGGIVMLQSDRSRNRGANSLQYLFVFALQFKMGLCARKGQHAFHSVSRKFPQHNVTLETVLVSVTYRRRRRPGANRPRTRIHTRAQKTERRLRWRSSDQRR